MSKMSFFILLLLLSCRTLFGQTEFHGLTAGKSTRPDVERVLGQPVKEHSEVLVEYQPPQDARARVNKVYVQYRKGSSIVERIEALLVQPLNRSDVLTTFHLPQQPTRSRVNAREVLEEYFGPPFYLVLTYQGAEAKSGVARTGRYSRELFESAVAKVPQASNTTVERSDNIKQSQPLGDEWDMCETAGQTYCDTWKRSDSSWTGWGVPLLVTISGNTVRVERHHNDSGLRAIYKGTISGNKIQGTVDFCCDSLGNRSGTWQATIRRK